MKNTETTENHVCPWWLGYTFILPIRKYQHDPKKILAPHIKKGMTVMDYGCAMGYFSIPLAQMTGAEGKVYCVDIQDKMLARLQKRAEKYGVSDIIMPMLVGKDYKAGDLHEKLDFVLLFMVVHEVPDKASLFNDLFSMLKPGGKILFFEPKGHVSPDDFTNSINIALNAGFKMMIDKPLKKGLSVFLSKN
jgi:2-polyprenyl-3-methyl-5-hydroxy-6-metoxy-1,4-benzoquinol methylase